MDNYDGRPPGRFDLVIRGGRVIDPESGLDAVRDIAIAGSQIADIGENLPSSCADIDASGHVVAPGFIDLHSHAQTLPSMRLQVQDGVTTALELESGVGDIELALAESLAEGRPINYGFSTSWAHARMRLFDPDHRARRNGCLSFASTLGAGRWTARADSGQVGQILDRIEGQLSQGALGIGILAGYAPDTDPAEYRALASLAAKRQVPTFTHARHKGARGSANVISAAREVIDAATETEAHMHLCHINSTALQSTPAVGALIRQAQERGVSVTTEAYPYNAGMTAIGAPHMHPAVLSRLGISPHDLVVAATGERPRDAERLLELRTEAPDQLAIVHYPAPQVSDSGRSSPQNAFLLDGTIVASDALPFVTRSGSYIEGDRDVPSGATTHPRSTGTFGRAIRTMARETGELALAEIIRRCTLLPATVLEVATPAMRRKGRIRIGCDADIVVFDARTVSDRSTYEHPEIPSVGFRDVLVLGESVISNGVLTGRLPGRPVLGLPDV